MYHKPSKNHIPSKGNDFETNKLELTYTRRRTSQFIPILNHHYHFATIGMIDAMSYLTTRQVIILYKLTGLLGMLVGWYVLRCPAATTKLLASISLARRLRFVRYSVEAVVYAENTGIS